MPAPGLQSTVIITVLPLKSRSAMNDKPDLAERIGKAINELDIDFSRFSAVGWFVALLATATGGSVAYVAGDAMIERDGLTTGVGLLFCVTLIAVSTIMFRVLRWVARRCGHSITKPLSPGSQANNRG